MAWELCFVNTTVLFASTTLVVRETVWTAPLSFATLVMIRTVADASVADTVPTHVPHLLTTEYTFAGTYTLSVICI